MTNNDPSRGQERVSQSELFESGRPLLYANGLNQKWKTGLGRDPLALKEASEAISGGKPERCRAFPIPASFLFKSFLIAVQWPGMLEAALLGSSRS